MLAASVALLVLFSHIQIRTKILQKIIVFISSLSFSVYLIHVNPIIFENILKNRFIYLIDKPLMIGIAEVFSYSLLVFIVCIVIDMVRYSIFSIPKCIKKRRDKV